MPVHSTSSSSKQAALDFLSRQDLSLHHHYHLIFVAMGILIVTSIILIVCAAFCVRKNGYSGTSEFFMDISVCLLALCLASLGVFELRSNNLLKNHSPSIIMGYIDNCRTGCVFYISSNDVNNSVIDINFVRAPKTDANLNLYFQGSQAYPVRILSTSVKNNVLYGYVDLASIKNGKIFTSPQDAIIQIDLSYLNVFYLPFEQSHKNTKQLAPSIDADAQKNFMATQQP